MEIWRTSQQFENCKKIEADFLTSVKTEQTIIDKGEKAPREENSEEFYESGRM